ncbi:hypothetical protein CLHUN_02130 [Ruminiclostridium hungatei]|uniref:Uncharacterized protein n=1 Tax=Ruminiclostridium hungatei TaxID=48256 RepID=A0A1V4ST31_RUMHU|nr:hypothetical protein [Ruminiclostridium hungatei]OPX46397.1 hypothetical protein CLHUN_02130 [Ruminiclostridium hungatei]
MYNPSQDLTAVQTILKSDTSILSLLDLTGATPVNIAKRIIKRSQWSDLVGSDKRLCVYFLPARKVRNESFFEEVMEIDCHVPATEDYKAWLVQEQIFKLLHKKKVNNRYLYAEPPLGELPTMSGFFCCGSRYKFHRNL